VPGSVTTNLDFLLEMSVTANVAVVILTHNETIHLRRAIEHVASFAKEIFVVDSYSTDGTRELAQSLGAVVLEHPFQNYAKQFQWALDNAPITAAWVMRLDADEIIEPDLAQEIIVKLPELPPDVTGVNLNRKTIFMGKFIRHGGRYPLILLRIWRRGKARIEDRWMDEHMYLTEGRAVSFNGGFADHNLMDLTFFTDKHNRYASREALDVLNQRMKIFGSRVDLTESSTARQAKIKRFFKESVYNKIPFEISTFAYFLFRYVIQLGFLDGREGLIYHVLQGFWVRFLIGAKIRELETAVRNMTSTEMLRDTLTRMTRMQVDSYLESAARERETDKVEI
jgi:glycosyltransferase involved in cell wall biosynthesis